MKRYALPLSILGFIVIIIGMSFMGGSTGPDYTQGVATEPAIGEEWVLGNASSAVRFIEYSDFQCPACYAYQPLLKQVIAEYGDRVAFIFRHYPLIQIHQNADLAARVSEAAGKQGKFWEMHDKLFDQQKAWSTLLSPLKMFESYAGELGLDLELFSADVDSDAVRKEVANDYQRGARVGASGTPTFVLNGVKMQNPDSIEGFRAEFNRALGIQ